MFHLRPVFARAFSRVDLLVTLATVALLGGWLGFSYSGENGRIARCTWNLQDLGEAMRSFASDHGGALPPAGIEASRATWDTQIASYLKPNMAKSNSPSVQRQLLKAVAPKFFCPSDFLRRGDSPRSYAMSSHDMKPENWPPGPDNTTGLGLWWGQGDAERLLGHATESLNELALVKFSLLPDPANTLLLTEYPNKENRLGRVECIRVDSVSEQGHAIGEQRPQLLHRGRFNYLMADGHVELLTPLQTGGLDGHAGIWSIKKGD